MSGFHSSMTNSEPDLAFDKFGSIKKAEPIRGSAF